MITIKQKGDFKKLDKYFTKSLKISKFENINSVANKCIERLKAATPKDSGLTADSWEYVIIKRKGSRVIKFYNTNNQNGVSVALLLEYGHATRDGAWVSGSNYIEPVVRETYLSIINNTWKEMTDL